MRESKVAVVIVEYRDASLAEACIGSLQRGTFRDFSVFLIDNTPRGAGVPDPKTDRFPVTEDVPQVRYIASGENIGFCAGCNVGIELALAEGFDHVLILNYDTVAAPDFLESLVLRARSLYQAGRLGILGAKIHYQSAEENRGRRLWYAGGRLSRLLGVGKHFGYDEMDNGDYDAFREVSYVTGCCMLIPAETLRKAGGFKSELFMYLDDAEFCLRVRDHGFRLYYEPSAVLAHKVGPGFGKRNYPDYYLYFSIRNKPWITRRPLYRLYLFTFTLALAAGKLAYYGFSPGIKHRARKVRAIFWGVWDSFSSRHAAEKRFPELFAARGLV
ncbi:MAG: glycosyltransferase family 2 protein [Fibrobacteria bacterium]